MRASLVVFVRSDTRYEVRDSISGDQDTSKERQTVIFCNKQ